MVGAYTAAAVADVQTSNAGLKRDPGAHELNSWLLGKRPSLARYYATDAVVDGAIVFTSYKLLHSHGKHVRQLGWSLMIGGTAVHTSSAILNSRIR